MSSDVEYHRPRLNPSLLGNPLRVLAHLSQNAVLVSEKLSELFSRTAAKSVK
jgi:hypothetical protein